jgi:hypothetical protein
VFERIRYRRHDGKVFLYAFDLMELDGDDLRREALDVRKATLRSLLVKVGPGLRWNEHIEGDGGTIFSHACKLGLEGIVSKRKGSLYRSGRSPGLAQDEEPGCAGSEARGRRGLGPGTRALIVPPPFPLPLPDQRGCSRCRLGGGVPSVGHSSPAFARFGVNLGCSAFLEALRPLPEVGYFVHAGKIPNL